jgi:hypothetical protein
MTNRSRVTNKSTDSSSFELKEILDQFVDANGRCKTWHNHSFQPDFFEGVIPELFDGGKKKKDEAVVIDNTEEEEVTA